MDFHVLLDAPASTATRVQIAKLGTFKDNRYGEFTITPDDVADWQRNLDHLPGQRALIDKDHAADRSPRNTEAYGWITGNLGVDGDKVLADVEWTPLGKQAIEEGRYLFFSPTYGKHKTEDGAEHDNTLIGGALTNRPFLGSMPKITLASEDRLDAAIALADHPALTLLDVSAAERRLAKKEGNTLPDGSYPIRNTGQLMAAAHLAATGHGDVQGARKLIKRRAKELGVALHTLPGFASDSHPTTMAKELLTLLGLDENADDAKVLEAVTALAAKAATPAETDTRTLEQHAESQGKVLLDSVALADLTRKADAGEKAARQLAAQLFETSFDRAVSAGRAITAQKERMAEFYELDAEKTIALLDNGPQIVSTKPSSWDNNRLVLGDDTPAGVDPDSHKLDVQVKARLKELGQDMSHYTTVLEQILGGNV